MERARDSIPGWTGEASHLSSASSSARCSPEESRRLLRIRIRNMSFNQLAMIAIENKDLRLWSAITELRMQVLLASGSPEGTARFNKLEKLNVPPLSSASQYGAWREGWVQATEDVEGMPLLWTYIARRTRTESGHVPDSKSMTGDSVGIRQLLGPEADMSTAQLALLDRLERIIGAIEGIDDPDDLQPGDWLDVVRGRVIAEPIPSYRPAAPLDEEGQTPGPGTEGQAPPSPWQSVVASASSLEQASKAEGLSSDVRLELQEQARSQFALARGMQVAEAERAREAAEQGSQGPVQFLPDGGWGPPIPPPGATDSSSAGRGRSRFESAGFAPGSQTVEAESCRFVRWSVSKFGKRRVVVEDTRRDGRLRELARDRMRPSETLEQRKQR